jgi:RNA recognition motif-containing protein
VGSLPWAVNDDTLKETFKNYGNVVSARVVKDHQTNKSRGFGFVEMETETEATAAIEALNGAQMNGRSIIVNEAKPKG